MLIQVEKLAIAGKISVSLVVINTDYISELVVYSSWAKFLFFEQPEDRRRARKHEWIVTNTVAQIRAAMNTPYALNMIGLDVFPDNDITKATRRQFYNLKEIVKIYPHNLNRDFSWVLINLKGFKLERLLVDNYYLDFVSLGKTGSTSTTTSTTSTSSTSSTSTTSTSSTSTYTTATSTSSSTTLP